MGILQFKEKNQTIHLIVYDVYEIKAMLQFKVNSLQIVYWLTHTMTVLTHQIVKDF